MKNKKGCITTAVILLLIVAIVVIALAAITDGFKNWDVSTWFGGGDDTVKSESKTNPLVTDGNGNVLDQAENEFPASGLMFASSLAETYAADDSPAYNSGNTVKLTATVTPSTADNKAVDWTAAWMNASSEWATGKSVTDYLTVTQESDGSLTAIVTCKQAFGEQIIVTITSRQNALATATTTVDYYAKVTGANYSVKIGSNTYNVNDRNALPISSSSATGEVTPITSVGTLTENYGYTVTARLTSQAEIDVMDYYYEGMRLGDMGDDYSYTMNAYGSLTMLSVFDKITECKNFNGSEYWAEYLWYGVQAFYKQYTGDVFQFDITVTGKITGKAYNTSLTAPVDRTTLIVPVASIGISSDAVAF